MQNLPPSKGLIHSYFVFSAAVPQNTVIQKEVTKDTLTVVWAQYPNANSDYIIQTRQGTTNLPTAQAQNGMEEYTITGLTPATTYDVIINVVGTSVEYRGTFRTSKYSINPCEI